MADSEHVSSTTHFEEEELDSLHNNGVMGDFNEALAANVVNDDEIVDLVGGAQDAIERHKSTWSQPEDLPKEVSEKFSAQEPEPVLFSEPETESETLLASPTKVEEDATEQPTKEVIPDSTTVVEEPEEKVIAPEAEPEHTLIVPKPVEEIPEVPQAEPVSVIPEPIPEPVAIAPPPAPVEEVLKAPVKEAPVPAAPAPASLVDLLYWRDVKTTSVVFGAALLLLLSLSVCSIVSVCSYVGLALLSVTIAFRIYKGILQAIQKSDEGHPFKLYLEQEVALSEDVVHKYSDAALAKINQTIATLRRVFLVEDLVDSLKFAVLMWVLTYVGALFNGLTILILGLVGAFSCPIIYEKHQVQIDHYVGMVNSQIKDAVGKIQAKVPGLKRKAE